jgi:hypothetical protein
MGKKRNKGQPEKRIRIRGERRAQIDEAKLSLALWLLAKGIVEDRTKPKRSEPSGEEAV